MDLEPISKEVGEQLITEAREEQIRLTDSDREILRALEPVVDAIATLFGNNCEVLLHSLEDLSRSVVKIANGHVTGRSEGSPITDLGIKTIRNAHSGAGDVVGSYFSKTSTGKTLKSVTALIRNESKPIGLLCINLDLSVPLEDVLRTFAVNWNGSGIESPENFAMSSEELIHVTLDKAIEKMSRERQISANTRNKKIVQELYQQGIFDIKGAVDLVAKELGVSRYTIYNYLREIRE
jgi:predicted transcriptional regulator YheO